MINCVNKSIDANYFRVIQSVGDKIYFDIYNYLEKNLIKNNYYVKDDINAEKNINN